MVPETAGMCTQPGAERSAKASSPGRLFLALALCLLGVATFASRWCLRTDYLVGPDTLQTAAAVRIYDVSFHLPHPPGQPVTVALLRLLDRFVGSPHHSVIALACLADAGAAVLIFCLGALVCSRRAGLVAALLYVLSPMGWVSSTMGMSFSLDACLAAAIGLAAVAAIRRPGMGKAVVLGVLLGAVLGMRNNVNLVSAALLPLGAYALWRSRPWPAVAGAAAFAAALAAWAVPAVMWGASGEGYLAAVGHWWSVAGGSTSALHALLAGGGPSGAARTALADAVNFARESFHALGVAGLLAPFVIVPARLASGLAEPAPWRLAGLWLIPVALLALVGSYHIEEYVAAAMPMLSLLTAVGLLRASGLLREILAAVRAPRRREGDDRLARAFVITNILAVCVLNLFRLSIHLAEQPNESRTLGGRRVIARDVQMVAAPRPADLNASYLRTLARHCRGRRAVLIAADNIDFIQLCLYVPGQMCILPARNEAGGLRVLVGYGGRIEAATLEPGADLPLPAEVDLVVASSADQRVRIAPRDGLAEADLTDRENRLLTGRGRKQIYLVHQGPLRLQCAGGTIEVTAAGPTASAEQTRPTPAPIPTGPPSSEATP